MVPMWLDHPGFEVPVKDNWLENCNRITSTISNFPTKVGLGKFFWFDRTKLYRFGRTASQTKRVFSKNMERF